MQVCGGTDRMVDSCNSLEVNEHLVKANLYTIFFHFKVVVHERIILVLPPSPPAAKDGTWPIKMFFHFKVVCGGLSSALGVARCGRSAGCLLCVLWAMSAEVWGGYPVGVSISSSLYKLVNHPCIAFHTCIAHTIAILVHAFCAIYAPPPLTPEREREIFDPAGDWRGPWRALKALYERG